MNMTIVLLMTRKLTNFRNINFSEVLAIENCYFDFFFILLSEMPRTLKMKKETKRSHKHQFKRNHRKKQMIDGLMISMMNQNKRQNLVQN